MSNRKTSRAGTIKGSASSLSSVIEEELDQLGMSAEVTPVEAPLRKSQRNTVTKEAVKHEGKRKQTGGDTKIQQPFVQPTTGHAKSPITAVRSAGGDATMADAYP